MSTFLAGGGEAGELIRTIDWARTPVGPVEDWPASLKTTVGTIIHSRHPMFLWWGPELIQFYNDAYIPSFGVGRHPEAMGQRGAECWGEIWPIIGPQIDDVMLRGKPTWHEDHLVPISRNGRLEEVYWTYGYSPVFGDDGEIAGTLVVVTETTARVIAERRMRVVQDLTDATALATSMAAVFDAAVAVFSGAGADVPFALLYSVDAGTGPPEFCGSTPNIGDAAGAIDRQLSGRLGELAESDTAVVLAEPVAVDSGPWAEEIGEVLVAPIRVDERTTGYAVFAITDRLPFDDGCREFLAQLADEIAQRQARIEAFRVKALVEGERNDLLEQAPAPTALLTGHDHVFRLANPLFCEMVGRADIIGHPYLDVFPELVGTPLAGVLDEVYETGEPYHAEEMRLVFPRPGGGVDDRYFTFTLQPLRTPAGQVYGMMAVAADITAQVEARKSLESGQREREILLDELRAASRAKDEFLAMLGHELRNPLSPILTALQLMEMRGVRDGERERAIIERQVRHVVTLVDDLLDISRITRGLLVLVRERVSVAEFVNKAIEQASPLLDQRRHELVVDVPEDLSVDGDRVRLAQIVSNLLTNAAKYTPPEGRVEVSAAAEGGEVVLRVRDNGVGIRPEVLPQVLDAFIRGGSRPDRVAGLGLGLAIVKNLVSAHGGVVSLRSEGEGKGSECEVRLPLAADEVAAVPPAAVARSEPGDACRILLVDDNEDAAILMAMSLERLGHQVEVAFDAASALEKASRFAPQVALLDLGLPVIDGYELAERLREREEWSAVRFIAVTGYGQSDDRERTRAAGFAAHMTKPVDLAELDAEIRSLARSEAP
jgi:PAS domain S-box-containing protein